MAALNKNSLTCVALLLFGISGICIAFPHLQPFFFLCNIHGKSQELGIDEGEISLSISIKDNPEYYEPGLSYEVTILSSNTFDHFLLTGLYSMSDELRQKMFGMSSPIHGESFLCSTVHSHSSSTPQYQLKFIWIAPKEGTGCVSFRATAALSQTLLFKDTTVLQLCEKGGSADELLRPRLTSIHTDDFILRDNFDDSSELDSTLWLSTVGLEVGTKCGVVLHGQSVIFCSNDTRRLSTVPLNTTSAAVIQFSISSGNCTHEGPTDAEITFSYGTNACSSWTIIEKIPAPVSSKTVTHLVRLPKGARQQDICFSWTQEKNIENALSFKKGGSLKPLSTLPFTNCWALDNVLVPNLADPPQKILETFDPFSTDDWLFLPGAKIGHKCRSEGDTVYFDGLQKYNYIVSQDMDLSLNPNTHFIYKQNFEESSLPEWIIDGGSVSDLCGPIDQGKALVFHKEGTRRACSPFMDGRKFDNFRFYISFGNVNCTGELTNKAKVIVYIEASSRQTAVLASYKPLSHRIPLLSSLTIPPENKYAVSRICWEQKYHRGPDWDEWAIDSVRILPHLKLDYLNEEDRFLQFNLNLKCGLNLTDNSVALEFSTDHGQTWNLLHSACLPGSCDGSIQTLNTVYHSSDYERWERFTLPIPHGAMVPYIRFRWRMVSPNQANWAVDNIMIGTCPAGCNGHGVCRRDICECDFGFSGDTCETAVIPNPTSMMEMFATPTVLTSSAYLSIKGAELSYNCGVVSTGKSLVFNKDGRRELVTTDMNTTNVKFVQFHIRVGSDSSISECRPPDRTSESIFLEYSCNGGIIWHLLKTFSSVMYKTPQMDSVQLPDEAKGTNCRFRWSQPKHSGSRLDVWALDDISLNNILYHTLDVESKDLKEPMKILSLSHGKLIDTYCGIPKTISFVEVPKKGEARYIMTDVMKIGPSYMIQFNLSMGCGDPYVPGINNKIYLEYSTDHGLNWEMVETACLPPTGCEEFNPGTVYEFSQYPMWSRITVELPPDTWSHATKFRLIQYEWSPTDTWSVNRIYIGQQCPFMCHGHGICDKGICRCDSGFDGESCEPNRRAKNGIQADFGTTYTPEDDFEIKGGDTVSGFEGCGTIVSGESMYFYQDGMRELKTTDIHTTDDDYIQFYIQIGGSSKDCNGVNQPEEGILLQYSTNAGISWKLLEELVYTEYRKPKFVHVKLPEDAKTANTRFRWWQPMHSGEGTDQWAVDGIYIGRYERMRFLDDDFNRMSDKYTLGPWLLVTDGINGKYCESDSGALILSNQENDKYVMTKDLELKAGDTIQFMINVDCQKKFRWDHPVMLQYSHDNGNTWKLVESPCYEESECDSKLNEGSVYYSGTHGDWTLIVIPVTDELASRPLLLRWWQRGGMSHSFALDNIHIGSSCLDRCFRNGICQIDTCNCKEGFKGKNCYKIEENPIGMIDRFDNQNEPNELWKRTVGSMLGTMCGIVDTENALFFPGDGTREAVTVPIDTRHLRLIQFHIAIGSLKSNTQCRRPQHRHEGVILDYSTNNEITWDVLKVIEPILYNTTTQIVSLELPPGAKTNRTVFRWWQPLGFGSMPRAEWGIDSVIVGVNDTSALGFQDDFSRQNPDPSSWFITHSGIPRISCHSKGHALEFSRNSEKRYAETWDYNVLPSTFLQFDISMGCGTLYNTLYSVMLEYSIDTGKTWHAVVDECAPPNFVCNGYHLSSQYVSEQHINWTRITVYLPPAAISPATRFRWVQHTKSPRGDIWALDNVYLGSGCPWLCSGHGYCDHGRCVCDPGFIPPSCVPEKTLPMNMRDDFSDPKLDHRKWKELYGGDVSDMCGSLNAGNALVFYKDLLRMVVTENMDTTMINTLEFYFKYACKGESLAWPRRHSVLFQYSINGGITWNLLHEIHYKNDSNTRFFTLFLPPLAKANATKFRFWQPKHGGSMQSTWAVDNFFVGTMLVNQGMLSDDFSRDYLDPDLWQFSNNGKIGPFCEHQRREDTKTAGTSALVFKHGVGEHSIVTRELDIGPMSVIQFDINVGCGASPTHRYPVRLEYSVNGGKTWHLIVPNCAEYALARCDDQTRRSSIYYAGYSNYWNRVVIPLDGLHVCGSIRFRWTQGHILQFDHAPEWAIDNVFIGMMCFDNCNGHGSCGPSMECECDRGYGGESCTPIEPHPNYIKEEFLMHVPATSSGYLEDIYQEPSFQLAEAKSKLNEKRWLVWSNGRISKKACGLLISGASLYFGGTGDRILVARDLDLSRASMLQFFLRLGCKDSPPSTGTPPVYVQYSIDGGITWTTFEQFDFSSESNQPEYIALHLPEKARMNSTQLQWWQPSIDGTFPEEWAIDQIYAGGDIDGIEMLQDEPKRIQDDSSWLLKPGAEIKKVCDSPTDTFSFEDDGKMRYAISRDVTTRAGTFLQFEFAIGCEPTKECYGMELEFSLDMGVTWKLLQQACVPSQIDCTSYHQSSTFMSDMYYGWNRATVPVPYYAKSKSTRFRWIQHAPFNKKQTWALRNLYIGKSCAQLCSGHGWCHGEVCRCDPDWMGDGCHKPKKPLPTILKDSFTDVDSSNGNWLKLAGARIDKLCQVIASGKALHFIGACNRILISRDLDLRDSKFIQFYFMFGCNTYPVNRDQSVLIDYSADGGVSWSHITELYYNLYQTPTFVNFKIPPGAKKEGVRMRWWQPMHNGKHVGDWAIDDIVIGGNTVNPLAVTSNFTTEFTPPKWLTTKNLEIGEYCGRQEAAVAKPVNGEGATLTSRDVSVEVGYILQFSINVGCGAPWNSSISPVHLQYSTNYGKNWYYVTPQCITKDPQCNTDATTKSIYYPTYGWERIIIPLKGHMVSSSTRFQWFQHSPGLQKNSEDGKEWAIKDIYIGPACNSMCQGHGFCKDGFCECDQGYIWEACYPKGVGFQPAQLKDTFNETEIDKNKWFLVQGATIQNACRELVDGTALVFSGSGMRLAQTIDLDLRDSTFIQYIALIGGEQSDPQCSVPKSRDQSVIVQYSTNGGIHWHTLHTLDYQEYTHPKRDYIRLPLSARTGSTRIRWWQPLNSGSFTTSPSWALDNIYIGGSEINPSYLWLNFTQGMNEMISNWEFSPKGKVQQEFCYKTEESLRWHEDSGEKSITTNQLIIQENSILQFKIAIGCKQNFNTCEPHSPIHLEFRKNPSTPIWDHILPVCLPDNNVLMSCRPDIHHKASILYADEYPRWTRYTLKLPEKTHSGTSQIRWVQKHWESVNFPPWAIDDIYIGEACPDMCNGRGDCRNGHCICDSGTYGRTCEPARDTLLQRLIDSFEGAIYKHYWESVRGGGIGIGCGTLRPHAHGKSLYFNGCGLRHAITQSLNLFTGGKIIFVLQIGCQAQTTECNVNLKSQDYFRGVLLQYSDNKGVEWKLLARHEPRDYLNPKQVAYDIPRDLSKVGVQFRWWQPEHAGQGHDQWAIDNVEILAIKNRHPNSLPLSR